MKCISCNSIIGDDAKFCTSCGAQIAQAQPENEAEREVACMSLTKCISEARPYASAFENGYDSALEIYAEKNEILETAAYFRERSSMKGVLNPKNLLHPFKSKKMESRAKALAADHNEAAVNGVKSGRRITVSALAVYFIAGNILTLIDNQRAYLIIYPVLIVMFLMLKLASVKRSRGYVESLEEAAAGISAQAYECADKAYAEYTGYRVENGCIPTQYLNRYALDFMTRAFQMHSAASVDEAIEQFEEYNKKQQALMAEDEDYSKLLKAVKDFDSQYRSVYKRSMVDLPILAMSLLNR